MHQIWYTLEPATNHKFPSHPECPERVEAVRDYLFKTLALQESSQVHRLKNSESIFDEQILAVHTAQYVEELQETLTKIKEVTALRDIDDPDGCTFATPTTWADARKASSSAVALVDAVLSHSSGTAQPQAAAEAAAVVAAAAAGTSGEGPAAEQGAAGVAAVAAVSLKLDGKRSEAEGHVEPSAARSAAPTSAPDTSCSGVCGFSICRPPGHHATPSEGMGFCLINHAAVAARHAQRAHGLERVGSLLAANCLRIEVMILDWDVHHGNGTQDIFYSDPSVLFVDIHQADVWPGTGAVGERGEGAGEGTTINVPLPWHSGHSVAQRAFQRVVVPAARRFRPQLIIVSAGYDAHWRDPLEHLQLQSATYHWLGGAVRELAQELCGGKCLCVLEGGYNQEAVGESVGETMLGLLGLPAATSAADSVTLRGKAEPLGEAEALIRTVQRLHGLPP